jgi:DNA-binding transcriptional LysR family regulator
MTTMDLWQLHIFCKVIEQRSFSKAAQIVYLSQPTISSHIKDLEDHFGTRLVDRLSREVIPTKAGELLYGYAKRLIALRDKTEAAMADFMGNVKGHLYVGGSTIPGGYLLPRLIGRYSQMFPEVHLTLRVADTSEIVQEILKGQIEMGVVGARAENKQLLQTALLEDEMKLVVPGDHKWAQRKHVSIEELLKEPSIIREAGSGTLASFARHLNRKGFDLNDLNIVAEMGSTEAIRQGIKSHVGVSILSQIAVADDVAAGLLKTVGVHGLSLKRSFYLTVHKQRSISPLCRTFIDFLLQEMQPAE